MKLRNLFKRRINSCNPISTKVPQAFYSEGFVMGDINETMHYTAKLTRKLLVEKGFSNSLDHWNEKYVLLGTEVSELADAVKKGLGESDEGGELADIVIRTCNFVANNEAFFFYMKSFDEGGELVHLKDDILQVHITKSGLPHAKDQKFEIVGELMDTLPLIRDKSRHVYSNSLRKENKEDIKLLIGICLHIIACCELYADKFLGESLQFYIDRKIRYNFERPYQYNTCEEFRN